MSEAAHSKKRRVSFFRRQYIVDPTMQFKIILFAVHTVGMTALATYCILDLVGSEHYLIAVLIAVVLLAFVVIPALLLSHSIAGPILRMKILVGRMIEGEKVEQIWLRQNDSFKDLAALLNKLVDNEKKNSED